MVVRFGIIGTNWITDQFIQEAKTHPQFELAAVYSRTEKRAKEFADKYGIKHLFTDVSEMAKNEEIDAVYIASPTSFHKEQTIICLHHKKHVLCEKPIASNPWEVKEMFDAAKENQVFLMEAMKTTLLPQFATIQKNIHTLGTIRSYNMNFCKYSSRYDAYRQGTILNAFKPEFSNGSLMDLGVYCIFPLVVLFGKPNNIQASALMLDSGVDGSGTVTLTYDQFIANIYHSKISTSYSPSEIQGEDGSFVIQGASTLDQVEWIERNGQKQILAEKTDEREMYFELAEFIQLIQEGKTESDVNSYEASHITAEILFEARKQMGLTYPSDHMIEDGRKNIE